MRRPAIKGALSVLAAETGEKNAIYRHGHN